MKSPWTHLAFLKENLDIIELWVVNYSLKLLDLAWTISFPRIYRRKLQLCMIPFNLRYICLCPVVSTETRKRLLSFCGVRQKRKKTFHIEHRLCVPYMISILHVLTHWKQELVGDKGGPSEAVPTGDTPGQCCFLPWLLLLKDTVVSARLLSGTYPGVILKLLLDNSEIKYFHFSCYIPYSVMKYCS